MEDFFKNSEVSLQGMKALLLLAVGNSRCCVGMVWSSVVFRTRRGSKTPGVDTIDFPDLRRSVGGRAGDFQSHRNSQLSANHPSAARTRTTQYLELDYYFFYAFILLL